MKAKLAFVILFLTCLSVAGKCSCPIAIDTIPATFRIFSLSKYVKFPEREIHINQPDHQVHFEFRINEVNGHNSINELTTRGDSPYAQIELQPAAVANLNDFSFSKSELTGSVIIVIQPAIFINQPHPLPERTINAFIRNGILQV